MRITKGRVALVLAPIAVLGLLRKYQRGRGLKWHGEQRELCGTFSISDELFPFESHFMDLPGGAKVHYVDEGPRDAAHTLLFLHGNPTWSLLYRDIIENLRPTYRCIAPDYPGFGRSTAPPDYSYRPREISSTLEAFVDKLNPGPFTMMVQDWGGPIGLGLAGRRPEFINTLVIGNTWAWPATPGGRKAFFSKVVGGPIGRFLARYFNGITRILMYFGSTEGLTEEEYRMYLRPFEGGKDCAQPTAILPREIVGSARYLKEVEEGLERVADRPVLILWGTADWAFSMEDLKRLEQTFRNHKTTLLEGASHHIQKDAPNRISEAIRQFLGVDTTGGTDKPTANARSAVAG